MDFGSVLHVAQKNEKMPKKEIKYYSTKFEPPKKEERSKQLSHNIKKFLARKEAEEKQKVFEARQKREELLALRSQDKKATRRVSVMLKRTKSANKSVIFDAIDNDNTAVTLAGPSQPDEDDYGYVSQEASAFYNKMMQKYSTMPEEDKFGRSKKNTNTNLTGTKDRVRAALLREQEEALLPHKRKRRSKDPNSGDCDDDYGPVPENGDKYAPEVVEKPVVKPRQKSAPPPIMNFSDLLKIAEKKQFEPIKIEPKVEKEEERPMTKKQKKEFEKEKAWRDRKEKAGSAPQGKPADKLMPPPNKIPKLGSSNGLKIPKLSGSGERPQNSPQNHQNKNIDRPKAAPKREEERSSAPKKIDERSVGSLSRKIDDRPVKKPENTYNSSSDRNKPSKLRSELEKNNRNTIEKEKQQNNSKISRPQSSSSGQQNPERRPPLQQQSREGSKSSGNSSSIITGAVEKSKMLARKEVVVNKDVRQKTSTPIDRPKQFPPADLKPRKFPPADVRGRQFPPKDVKRKPPMGHKRRILDDDSEYDSEMDDFIDDGPEGAEDYSKYISEIFGYDKSRFRNDDYGDDNMESSFSQMMKEEFISTKIGLLEDLEDMRQEAEDKKRKTMMKKMRK